jgi:hypothetical protein
LTTRSEPPVEAAKPIAGQPRVLRRLMTPSSGVGPALLATGLGIASAVVGWKGMDFAAQVFRASSFRAHGFTLWNSQWYGGHWTVNYSVLFPIAAGLCGVYGIGLLSAGAASWCFDRLLIGHFGPRARGGSVSFAVGTVVQLVVGQLPFLMGEALGLAVLLACRERRWKLALLLGVLTALSSPVAGVFLCLAILARLLAHRQPIAWPLAAVLSVAAAPMLVMSLAFPGNGSVHLIGADVWCIIALCIVVTAVLPGSQPALRIRGALYSGSAITAFVLPNPMGGSLTRLGTCIGVPLLFGALWPIRHRLLAVVVAALCALGVDSRSRRRRTGLSAPPSQQRYYNGLLGYLKHQDRPAGRIEVIPTSQHWEAAFVAPHVPLARGWERQVDTAANPVFYDSGDLTAASYRAWLLANGVRWVALADTPLDYAGQAEASLVFAGVEGLHLSWHDTHWRVWEVNGSTGIVSGPAQLVSVDADGLMIDVQSPILPASAFAHGQVLVVSTPGRSER